MKRLAFIIIPAISFLSFTPQNPVYSILIDKSEYQLKLMSGAEIYKAYPVVLGFDLVHDKMKEGDGCTPEGIFKVKAMYPHKSWSKFIWFDYPNKDSYKKFNQRKKDGAIQSTDHIGGDIGIHGVPAGMDDLIDTKNNWTLGCISLKTSDINEIYSKVKIGTTVTIVP